MKWRIEKWPNSGWTVVSPLGPIWTGARTHAAAMNLAHNLIGVQNMLTNIAAAKAYH